MKFSLIKRSLIVAYCFFSTQIIVAEISRDLELDAIFTRINYTHTAHGSSSLRALLAQPTCNQQILENRQATIAHIAHNQHLYIELNRLLTLLSSQEHHFQSIIQPKRTIETAAVENFYFSHPYCAQWNYSPVCLEIGQIAHFANLCSSLMQHSLAFIIFTWGLEEEHACAIHPPKKHTHADAHDHTHTDNGCNSCTHNQLTQHGTISTRIKAIARSTIFKGLFHGWHIIAQAQELYAIQAIVRPHLQCIKKLQSELMDIARAIGTIADIHAAVKNHPEIKNNVVYYKHLENIALSKNISEKLNTLLSLLKTPTFQGEPSLCSRIGIILAAYKLLQDVAPELQPALNAIGELDAYTSCAQLLKNHQSTPLQYSFAHYITASTTPSLIARNFWHPLISTENIQLNSISLGVGDAPRNIIVTGPNACGKSTNVKALTLCAYFAQTITLVPAEQFSHTIYKEIYSSMIVTDKIQDNMSTFVTELTNAEQLLHKVESLATGEYILVALDELFKSTHHEKGQLVAQRLLENLYASPQLITIVSTHFEQLTALPHVNSSAYANYTVNNFILEPGVGSPEKSFDIVETEIKSRLLQ